VVTHLGARGPVFSLNGQPPFVVRVQLKPQYNKVPLSFAKERGKAQADL
jgi:hypothetical protein